MNASKALEKNARGVAGGKLEADGRTWLSSGWCRLATWPRSTADCQYRERVIGII